MFKKILSAVMALALAAGTWTYVPSAKHGNAPLTANAYTDDDGNEYTNEVYDGFYIRKYADHISIHIGPYSDKKVVIPAEIEELPVTQIDDFAFERRSGITEIIIPDSITSIGRSVFYECTKLKSIKIPNSVTSMGIGVFDSCEGLTSITIPDSLTSIPDMTFYNCDNLTSVTMPDSVKSIGIHAFAKCDSLVSITIPNSVEFIDNGAFYYCKNLAKVTLPESVKSIDIAFVECASLAEVTILNAECEIFDDRNTI